MKDNGYKRDHISGWRWREITAVIMQYDDRKKRIKDLIRLPSGISEGSRASGVSDPTYRTAAKIAHLENINDAIDKVTSKLSSGPYLRKCYGYTQAVENGYPYDKNRYYREKRALYIELDRILY